MSGGCVHCLVVGLVPQVGVNPVMVSVQAKEKDVDVTPVPVVETFTVEQVTKVCILYHLALYIYTGVISGDVSNEH